MITSLYQFEELSRLVELMHQGINTAADKIKYEVKGTAIIQSRNFTSGSLDLSNVKYLGDADSHKYSDKYTPIRGDILFSNIGTVGKSVIIKDETNFVFAWNVFLIRVNHIKVDKSYLKFYLDYLHSIKVFESWFTGGTVKFLNKKTIGAIQIPLPPLETQKQIAAVLEKADQLRKDCQQMEQELNNLAQSVFIDMFGDSVTNPMGWNVKPLRELVSVFSGATPSKSNDKYWLGEIPWVSPKDMKVTEISNSIDHVNKLAFDETNLKRIPLNSILIVVRGMILAHTIPLAITRKELAINQDIKSMTVKHNSIRSEFLLGVLISMHSKLLSIVSSAAHGTKRIDATDLFDLDIVVPDLSLQDKYITALNVIKGMKQNRNQETTLYEHNFNSLMQKSFKGELILDKSAA